MANGLRQQVLTSTLRMASGASLDQVPIIDHQPSTKFGDTPPPGSWATGATIMPNLAGENLEDQGLYIVTGAYIDGHKPSRQGALSH
jgi:hypothetical protein